MTSLAPPPPTAVTVYVARLVRTMDPQRSTATHVAVRNGRVLAVGTLDEVSAWGPHTIDRRYEHAVLVPGFVEGHAHLAEGVQWRWTYCGFYDRMDPDGHVVRGLGSMNDVVERLRAAAADGRYGPEHEGAPIVGFGFDPIYFAGGRCDRHDLDQISSTRPVLLLHASGHITNVNSFVLQRLEWLRDRMDLPGVMVGDDGLPNGELRGPQAQGPAQRVGRVDQMSMTPDRDDLWAYGRSAMRGGVTTTTDLASALDDTTLARLLGVTAEPGFPIRLVPALHAQMMTGAPTSAHGSRLAERIAQLTSQSTELLRLGLVKAHADGSIQGFSARLRWPGYINGAPNGLWYIEPERLTEIYEDGLRDGFAVHVHANGDEAIDLAIECFAAAHRRHPRADHRFTLQHCQLVDRSQLIRMRALGMCANFFANHHFFWGDAHYETTVGPDRAERMNPCRTALEVGVPFAIHSDAPITPLRPLHLMWASMNRLTAGGRTLGEHEKIGVAEALHAVTLGAAFTLHLDGELGSIEVGKRADFAVLGEDPFAVNAAELRDVPVLGTVLSGIPTDRSTS